MLPLYNVSLNTVYLVVLVAQVGLYHRHPVGGQGTGLVRAYCRRVT